MFDYTHRSCILYIQVVAAVGASIGSAVGLGICALLVWLAMIFSASRDKDNSGTALTSPDPGHPTAVTVFDPVPGLFGAELDSAPPSTLALHSHPPERQNQHQMQEQQPCPPVPAVIPATTAVAAAAVDAYAAEELCLPSPTLTPQLNGPQMDGQTRGTKQLSVTPIVAAPLPERHVGVALGKFLARHQQSRPRLMPAPACNVLSPPGDTESSADIIGDISPPTNTADSAGAVAACRHIGAGHRV